MPSATKLTIWSWFRRSLDRRRRSRLLARRRAKLVAMGFVKVEEASIWYHPNVDLAVDERAGIFISNISLWYSYHNVRDDQGNTSIMLTAIDEEGEI
jgi:hypothetical protein